MKNTQPAVRQIELRITQLSELFNSMDPTPFHHRNLDTDAEEFLENWALDFPAKSHFHIIVHIEQMPAADPTALATEAIHNHFKDKAERLKHNLRVLLKEGRDSLLIGTGFLLLCLFGAEALAGYANNTFLRLLDESLIIGGWVAMWRPLQIFLYDWWPILRRIRIYRNLGHASVNVVSAEGP
jgi:hypothetical protein